MSEAVESKGSNPTPENLSDFLSVQKSSYLRAIGEGEAQRDVWTISMGNEAGGWFLNHPSPLRRVPDDLIDVQIWTR
jgi:hypothetical protein